MYIQYIVLYMCLTIILSFKSERRTIQVDICITDKRFSDVAKDINEIFIMHNCTVGEAKLILELMPSEFDKVLIK